MENVRILAMPEVCPCCGQPTEVRQDEDSGVLTLWCVNPNCPAQSIQKLKHFVTRDAMNIDGISESTLNTLVEYEIIDDFASIFKIHEHEEVMQIPGFGEKSFYNMVNSIEKARKVKLENFIYALGIPNVGLNTAKLIARYFNYNIKDTFLADYVTLTNIEGVGDTIAENFFNYFHTAENIEELQLLLNEIDFIKQENNIGNSMAGVTICVTGDVYIFPNRRAIQDVIEQNGGKLTGSVSKKTSYLVTNDTTSGSRKNVAAQQLGIPILTEQEFIDKFNIQV